MENTARGTFTVKLTPVEERDEAAGARLGRMTIAKTFTGDIEATAQGEMLTTLTDVEGSAGFHDAPEFDQARAQRRAEAELHAPKGWCATSPPDLTLPRSLANWGEFGPAPRWVKLWDEPQYKDNTSKNTARFLVPTPYSQI